MDVAHVDLARPVFFREPSERPPRHGISEFIQKSLLVFALQHQLVQHALCSPIPIAILHVPQEACNTCVHVVQINAA
jgi:hypothetical protein